MVICSHYFKKDKLEKKKRIDENLNSIGFELKELRSSLEELNKEIQNIEEQYDEMEEDLREIRKMTIELDKLEDEVLQNWKENCAHMDSLITLVDGDSRIQGIFKGVSQHGEAVIEFGGVEKPIVSGSILLGS